MTPVEDRTRAAMDAITGLVEKVPPLRLPPPALPAGAPSRRRRRLVPSPRRLWGPWPWGPWLAPAAAAAAVLAIAITLVAARDMPDTRPSPAAAPAGAPAGLPAYYLTFSQPQTDMTVPVGLVLAATLTGKKLATLAPPHGLSFSGITGAADDRTFVAAAHWYPYGVQTSQGRMRTWYLVRVGGTGTRVSLTMTRLPIPATKSGTDVAGIALSPDGTMLAVATQPYTDLLPIPQVLRVYSVATGRVLHTWRSAPGSRYGPIDGAEGEGADDNAALTWVGNRALAYFGGVQTGPRSVSAGVMVLDLSRPDGGITASSRLAVPVTFDNDEKLAPFGCGPVYRGDIAITGNGKSFVCGGEGTSDAKLPTLVCGTAPVRNTAAFASFSLTTGKLTRFLAGYRTNCFGYAVQDPYPVWVNATGSTLIGYIYFGGGRQRFGVFTSPGSFRPLPLPVPGNWDQYMNGSLLYQVAW